ncbi:MAG: FGGY-family carbohydrate kinase [Clostridium sp.]|uniref:FGGY-family carbohydrate kinase n=1 Tax=Clostridium sp. TaxID=1506 RepID=UPI003D6D28A4
MNGNGGYILTLDCGTQSVRAILFDDSGSIIGKEKVEFEPYFSKEPGWAEQDPDVFWNNCCTACKTLKIKQPKDWEKIIGVTVTTQRDTGVIVDKQGTPLRPAIIWLDQRMAKCEEPLAFYDNAIFKTIRMDKTIEMTRRKSKSNWIIENEPEKWEAAHKYLLLSGYFIFKLTGKFVDSVASQIGHVPFDYKNQCWPKSKISYRWKMFGIEREKLYDLVQPGEIISGVTACTAEATGIKEGIPVIAAGSDKGCETLGVGCLDPSTASMSFGTTATVQITSKSYMEPLQFMPPYPASIPGYYNPEVEIFRGYWMISWFKKEFCAREVVEAKERGISPESILNEKLNDIPPGSQGLILQPFWGPGLKMLEAKGSLIGFGDVHTRAHIYRAIIEGINYALIDGLEKIEKKSKVKVKTVIVSGGGSQSDAICQITADMFNRPVLRGQTYETSGLGAAINGFVGLKIFESYEEAVSNMVHYTSTFEPDSKNTEIYRKLYKKVYCKIYPKLESLFKEIKKITNYPSI